MSEELKPCPFCGQPAVESSYDEDYPVTCDNPNCIMWPHFYTVAQWNYRPGEDTLLRADAERLAAFGERIQTWLSKGNYEPGWYESFMDAVALYEAHKEGIK